MLKNSKNNNTYYIRRAKPNSDKYWILKNTGMLNFKKVEWISRLKEAEMGVRLKFDLIFFLVSQARSFQSQVISIFRKEKVSKF